MYYIGLNEEHRFYLIRLFNGYKRGNFNKEAS